MNANFWVILVNYRSAALVCECLRALFREFVAATKIVIVDNDSGDDSVDVIRDFVETNSLSLSCSVVPSFKNGGFSYGNNLALNLALSDDNVPDYFVLLNPDTVICENAMGTLVSFLEQHPNAGIAGSSLVSINGSSEPSAHVFPSPLGELEGTARLGLLSRILMRYRVTPEQPSQQTRCDWVSGASMIIRRRVVEQVGLMDEGFFLYFEEVDFCKRAQAAGWECWYVPESRVIHLEGASTGIKKAAARRPRYWYDSRRRYFVKHHGVLGLVVADTLWALGRLSYLSRRLLKLGAQGENRDPKWFMYDLLLGDLRAILRGDVFRIERFGK